MPASQMRKPRLREANTHGQVHTMGGKPGQARPVLDLGRQAADPCLPPGKLGMSSWNSQWVGVGAPRVESPDPRPQLEVDRDP